MRKLLNKLFKRPNKVHHASVLRDMYGNQGILTAIRLMAEIPNMGGDYYTRNTIRSLERQEFLKAKEAQMSECNKMQKPYTEIPKR